MFKLEQSIAKWRRQMLATGVKTPVPLDELENHLREDIEALVAAGQSEDRAFQLAVSRLGSAGSVRTEFNKVKLPARGAVKVGSFILILTVSLLAILELRRIFIGQSRLLYDAHMLSLTAGYFAVLMTGGFGIYYVCCRLAQPLSAAREEGMNRAVFLFSRLSAGFVFAGLVLGMIWTKQNRGSYFPGNPSAVGCGYVLVWLLASCVIQRFSRVTFRVTALLSVGGNILVSLAWFGAGLLINARDMWSYWPLHVLLGIHLLFLLMGVVPESKMAEA
jgi:hypothetical protein